LLAVGGLLWWNAVVAPGLYGNAPARSYLEEVATAFDRTNGSPAFTARFVAPATDLVASRAIYFSFVPAEAGGTAGEEAPCRAIRGRVGSAATWMTYSVGDALSGVARGTAGPSGCVALPSSNVDFIRKVVFASGSPFPIFPAHRLAAPGPGGVEHLVLVDGGYSNNVPVDAALTVGAEQVLILRSSAPPAPAASGVAKATTPLLGPLAGSLDRLLAYLFERSQSIDRLSSNELFVVSLSPSGAEHWPPLFDFRRTTVQRMLREAESDLGRRIGRVESWGLPHFRIVFQIGASPERPRRAMPHLARESRASQPVRSERGRSRSVSLKTSWKKPS
jgi:hypothetical protein